MCEYCETTISSFENCDDWAWGQNIIVNILARPHKKGWGLVRLDYCAEYDGAPVEDYEYYYVDHRKSGTPIYENRTQPDECPFCGRDLYPGLYDDHEEEDYEDEDDEDWE